MRIWDSNSGECQFSIVTGADDEYTVVDFERNRILRGTADACRLLGCQTFDKAAGRWRMLPAEYFGPLPTVEVESSGVE